MSQGLKISVAICTWNRSRQLAVTLDRLARVTNPSGVNWDVLVVNNACSDDTSAVVASYADRLHIRETHEPRPGVAGARNRALAETTGSHIAFIDDDVLVEREWLTTYARLALRQPATTSRFRTLLRWRNQGVGMVAASPKESVQSCALAATQTLDIESRFSWRVSRSEPHAPTNRELHWSSLGCSGMEHADHTGLECGVKLVTQNSVQR